MTVYAVASGSKVQNPLPQGVLGGPPGGGPRGPRAGGPPAPPSSPGPPGGTPLGSEKPSGLYPHSVGYPSRNRPLFGGHIYDFYTPKGVFWGVPHI